MPVETHAWTIEGTSHVCPGANRCELGEAQDRLEEMKNAYGQLVGAHRLMIEKYELALQTNRKWYHYYHNVSKRPKDEEPTVGAGPKSISNPANGQQTMPNVLAMPSPSLSNASASCSPSKKVLLDTRAMSQNKDTISSTCLAEKISSQREVLGAQDVFDIPPDSKSDNFAETCDESQNESVIERSLIDERNEPVDQNIKPPTRPIDDGSDSPVIVAERSLKRKRDSSLKQGNREVHGEHTHYHGKQKPIRVKSELDSSSPVAPVSIPRFLDPQDSIDLDEVGEKHFTPRKHRRLLDERPLRAAGLRAPIAADFDENSVEHRVNDQYSKSLQGQNFDSEKDEQSEQYFDGEIDSEEDWGGEQPFACDKAIFMKQAQEYSERLWEEHQQNNAGRLETAKSIPPKVLKTTDPNIKLLPRTSGSLIDRRPAISPNRQDRSFALISTVTEDGVEYSPVDDRKSSHTSSAVMKAKQASARENLHKTPRPTGLHQRLDTLLAKPSPQNGSQFFGSPVIEVKKSTKMGSESLEPPVTRNNDKTLVTPISKRAQVAEKVAGGTKPSKPTRPGLRSRAQAKPVSPILSRMREPRQELPEYKSLRARPLAALRPTDFKLNPARNHGYDYPFSEVVRDRDLRKSMPGCKKPGCCGTAIRNAVEIGGYTAPRKCGLLSSSPEEDVEKDERLLEEYLGDNKSHLKGMSAEERQKLLLQARTEQFANVHGKHRYVHGRAQSPPGYWDPDMPDTQREKENRAAAIAYDREKTADMYREALRPDGLYRFRDE